MLYEPEKTNFSPDLMVGLLSDEKELKIKMRERIQSVFFIDVN
jgi:hypothetical protein